MRCTYLNNFLILACLVLMVIMRRCLTASNLGMDKHITAGPQLELLTAQCCCQPLGDLCSVKPCVKVGHILPGLFHAARLARDCDRCAPSDSCYFGFNEILYAKRL